MIKDFSNLKVAIVTDSMIGFGGADRLMISLFEIFPNREIFTSVYNRKKYKLEETIHTSFLQYLRPISRYLSFLFPFAFENFNLSNFDFIISLSAGPAKFVIPGIYQPHLSIILTPPRHYWDLEINVKKGIFKNILTVISNMLNPHMRILDLTAVKRIRNIVSISKYIQQKVKRIYGRESMVVYPGVSEYWFEKPNISDADSLIQKYNLEKDFLLISGRLYEYKHVDWAIRACIKSKKHLYIVGEGPEMTNLKTIADNSEYIHFLGHLPDNELRIMYSLASCYLFPALEDFGIVVLEAMAQGTPTLCLSVGGPSEIVISGITGELFGGERQMQTLISKKVWTRYNPKEIIARAEEFSNKKFLNEILKEAIRVYETERKTD